MEHDDTAALAAAAFAYGFPLVFDLREVDRVTRQGIGGVPATPFNRFGHAATLAGPEARFVSINNDTVYSIAQLDPSAGPVRLEVPDTGGRYHVLQAGLTLTPLGDGAGRALPDPGLAAALRAGLGQGRQGLEQALTHSPAPSRTAGTSPTTSSTTTSTSSRSAPSGR